MNLQRHRLFSEILSEDIMKKSDEEKILHIILRLKGLSLANRACGDHRISDKIEQEIRVLYIQFPNVAVKIKGLFPEMHNTSSI
jgi:hypothetical protein